MRTPKGIEPSEVGEEEGEGEGHAGSRAKTRGAGDPGGEDAALHAAEVVGGVLRLRAQRGAVEDEGGVGVEEDEVGRGAGGEAAGGEAEEAGRVERERAPEGGEGQVAGVVELHRGGEEGLEADGAAGGLLEGQALLLLVLRGVEGADDVDQPVGQRLDHGHAVVLGARAAGSSLKKVR